MICSVTYAFKIILKNEILQFCGFIDHEICLKIWILRL